MGDADGVIIIGTEVDDGNFYQKIREYEGTKVRDIEIDPKLDESKLRDEIIKAHNELEKMPKIDVISEQEIMEMQDYINLIDVANARLYELTGKKLYFSGLNDAKKDLEEIGEATKRVELNKVEKQINNIGDSIKKTAKNVVKWSFAVIGIRSIYNGIRGAISTISQYDEGIGKQIEYIRFALANALKPIIEWIINAFFQLIALVGRFVYLLTGKNIFENSGVKDFEKAMDKSAGSAKEIKKSLAGFDEMNILSDNSSSSSGAGGSSSFDIPDLSKMVLQETAIEKVTNDLIDKWFELGETFEEGLANPDMFDDAYGHWSTFFSGIVQLAMGAWDAITGLAEIIGGVFDIIVGLFTGNEELITQGWQFFIDGLGKRFMGIIEAVVGILKIIWGVIVGLLGEVLSGVQGLLTWIWEALVSLWNGAVDIAGNAWEGIKDIFGNVASFFGDVFGKAWEAVKNVFSTGGRIFAGITEGILEAFKRIVNVIIDGINEVVAIPFRGINTALSALRSLDLWGWKPFEWIGLIDVPRIPRLARGGIVNNPGPGVMMGSYVAGERGPEAVIPLDDETLDRLGLAFARHTEINATVPVYVGNRQVAREIKRINAENDFAYNS